MRVFVIIFLIVLVFPLSIPGGQAVDFDTYFLDETMRIDYYHLGDKNKEFITLDKIYRQGQWAGSRKNLLDSFGNGNYYVKVYDQQSGKLVYSRGFDSYFREYQTTTPAAQGVMRTYHETALIPYPRNKIVFTVAARDRQNRLNKIFGQEVDPGSRHIITPPPLRDVKVFPVVQNGHPHNKVDLALIAEGYTLKERKKFKADLKRFRQFFFSREPYKSHAHCFNINGVFRPSADSGCDEPRKGIYKNTAVEASFNALDLERYLLTEGNKPLHDIAAQVPTDALIIMVNTDRYGGGGIYNFYCVFAVDSEWHEYLMFHEFGHAFAGLADEYYASAVSYNEFYPPGVEPTEANITALLDPRQLKWKDLVTPGTPIPTPWDKDAYDKMSRPDQANHLKQKRFQGVVGAFEGAGYASEGLYRPMIDCTMFTKGNQPYCRVCEAAIIRVIHHYSQ
jgi:hypothetical protein